MNSESTEYDEILFYPKAVYRATRNLPEIQQGQLCVLDFDSVQPDSVDVYVANTLDDVNEDTIRDNVFRSWKKTKVRCSPGYMHNWKGNSIRRIQFPLANYVALTIHKLMGDTFTLLASAISASDTEYALWLISQLYVLISRVRSLHQLFFVGKKCETLFAIKQVLQKRNLHEERIFKLFLSMKNAAIGESGPNLIEATTYLQRHFEVPETANGYIYLLVSMKDRTYRTFHIAETGKSLSEELKQMNSTEVIPSSFVHQNQPWAVGFFFWNFMSKEERVNAYSLMKNSMSNNGEINYDMLREKFIFLLRGYSHLLHVVCGTVKQSIF